MTNFAIFRKCTCGFSTWFDSEEKQHLEEMEGDVHEHKFVSLIAEEAK
jgi:hypothetical protein